MCVYFQILRPSRHDICQIFYTSTLSKLNKLTPKIRANRNILNVKCVDFGFSMELEFFPMFMLTLYFING